MNARKAKRRACRMMGSPVGRFVRRLEALWRSAACASPFVVINGPEMWHTVGGFDPARWSVEQK